MAELQMKLKQYEKAERTVSQALDAENNGSQRSNNLNSLMTQVWYWIACIGVTKSEFRPNVYGGRQVDIIFFVL